MTTKVPDNANLDNPGVNQPTTAAAGKAAALAEIYGVLGPLYRRTVAQLERSEHHAQLGVGVRAVLELLDARGPQPVPRIAATLALSRQFVQRSVNAARADGLAATRANPAHRRSVLVELTAAGQARIAGVRRAERRALAPVGESLAAADIDACLRVLRALGDGLPGDDSGS